MNSNNYYSCYISFNPNTNKAGRVYTSLEEMTNDAMNYNGMYSNNIRFATITVPMNLIDRGLVMNSKYLNKRLENNDYTPLDHFV